MTSPFRHRAELPCNCQVYNANPQRAFPPKFAVQRIGWPKVPGIFTTHQQAVSSLGKRLGIQSQLVSKGWQQQQVRTCCLVS